MFVGKFYKFRPLTLDEEKLIKKLSKVASEEMLGRNSLYIFNRWSKATKQEASFTACLCRLSQLKPSTFQLCQSNIPADLY